MSEWVHRILDTTDADVLCAECGWVRKTIKNGIPKCSVARNNARRKYRGGSAHSRRRGDSCDVCGSTERLCVDHDHSCCPAGTSCDRCFRGTLCNTCNITEGMIRKMAAAGALDAMLGYMGLRED